jgi:hypothetical protein
MHGALVSINIRSNRLFYISIVSSTSIFCLFFTSFARRKNSIFTPTWSSAGHIYYVQLERSFLQMISFLRLIPVECLLHFIRQRMIPLPYTVCYNHCLRTFLTYMYFSWIPTRLTYYIIFQQKRVGVHGASHQAVQTWRLYFIIKSMTSSLLFKLHCLGVPTI